MQTWKGVELLEMKTLSRCNTPACVYYAARRLDYCTQEAFISQRAAYILGDCTNCCKKVTWALAELVNT